MAARRAGAISTGASQINTGDSGPTDSQPADLAKLKRYFAEARDLTLVARTNATLAQDYYDSDQFTPREKAALQERRQAPIVVNRIKPAIKVYGTSQGGSSYGGGGGGGNAFAPGIGG